MWEYCEEKKKENQMARTEALTHSINAWMVSCSSDEEVMPLAEQGCSGVLIARKLLVESAMVLCVVCVCKRKEYIR